MELGGFGELGAVALDVAAEGGEDGGDVGEEDVGEAEDEEAQARWTAAGAQLDGTLGREVRKEGRVVRARVRALEAALHELDEYEGAGPDGGAHVHGPVVLLE